METEAEVTEEEETAVAGDDDSGATVAAHDSNEAAANAEDEDDEDADAEDEDDGDNVTFQPNPHSFVNNHHLSYFKFIGRIIGKAICDGHLLDCALYQIFL